MNVTNRVANYIREKNISPEQIARDTGVEVRKLIPHTNAVLSATEFLELCVYLGIRPEDMYGNGGRGDESGVIF